MQRATFSERLFVWTELALSSVLAGVARLRGEPGGRTVGAQR